MPRLDESSLDAVDRRLIHALQIEPRASWKSLEPVVGVNASTLARRWARISEEGIAWVTGWPRGGQAALIEIECELNQITNVMRGLVNEPYVESVELCSGSRSLLTIVNAPNMVELSQFLTERLSRMSGIRTVHTHVASEIHVDGSDWRLRELNDKELARMPAASSPRPRAAQHVAEDLKLAVFEEVWKDGRVPVSTIAEQHGFSPQRVADAIASLRASNVLRFRTDIARSATEWATEAWYFLEAPARLRDAIKHTAVTVPEIRYAMTTTSRSNLVLIVWLRKLGDVHRFEIALEAALQGARIIDRSVSLQSVRHLTREIGPETTAVGRVQADSHFSAARR